MDVLMEFFNKFIIQLQSPVLGFLIGGALVAAFNSKLRIPDAIYQFIVFMLLMRVGLNAGMEIREANFVQMLLPIILSIILGFIIVVLGWFTLAKLPGVKKVDALATSGLFGAVSAATLVAGMTTLNERGIFYEDWIPALYPFMDITALATAIILANIYIKRQKNGNVKVPLWPIIKGCLQGSALTAMILGTLLGLLTRPEKVFIEFYDPLFRGFLSILMLILGMEAFKYWKELIRVAHWYVTYSLVAPIVHGLLGFGLGYIAHLLVGLSPGGVIMLAIIASSSSDISGPPTLRAGIPTANPSAYVGASTTIGTPVVIAIGIPLFMALGEIVFGL